LHGAIGSWAPREREFGSAFAQLVEERAEALLIVSDVLFVTRRQELASLAARYAIPTIYPLREYAVSGGLLSYGASVAEPFHPSGGAVSALAAKAATSTKRLELLISAMPGTPAIAMLVNPKNPNAESEAKEIEAAARTSGRALRLLNASTESDIDVAFEALVQQRLCALLVGTDTFFYGRRDQLVELAARHTIRREFIAGFGRRSGVAADGVRTRPDLVNKAASSDCAV
jgi:hypothetical protein